MQKTAHNPGCWIYAVGYTLNQYNSMFILKKHMAGNCIYAVHAIHSCIEYTFPSKISKVFLHKIMSEKLCH